MQPKILLGAYRYGFNGQEHSDDVTEGNYTALFWEYDARIGRRWNVDPVSKPWQSSYTCFSNSPIIKVDFNGDDDFFNSDGSFAYRTKTGTLIKVLTEDGAKLLSDIKPNTPNNVKALVNIVGHYRNDASIPNNVQLGISPNTSSKQHIAYTTTLGIMVSAKDGVSKTENDYNSLISTLVHEEKHREAGDPQKGNAYKYSDHTAIYEKQMDDKTFKNTSNEFKTGMLENYSQYLLGALDANEIDENQFNNKVIAINNKFKKEGIGIVTMPSSSGTPLVFVRGKSNKGEATESKPLESKTSPH
ncbi:hypothetical protein [Parasediminibacterium sp. JCM 36343]|uniref:hypothetical protein n=1 Tax=Parasediminibacterium sp. JCM 36343 TaxID=3374279 RepID=UPI0039792218